MKNNKFVLYDSTDDTVVIRLDNDEVLLFDTKAEAKKAWFGYPEEVTKVKDLPLHWQEEILNQ